MSATMKRSSASFRATGFWCSRRRMAGRRYASSSACRCRTSPIPGTTRPKNSSPARHRCPAARISGASGSEIHAHFHERAVGGGVEIRIDLIAPVILARENPAEAPGKDGAGGNVVPMMLLGVDAAVADEGRRTRLHPPPFPTPYAPHYFEQKEGKRLGVGRHRPE